jgi:hypothetical protein
MYWANKSHADDVAGFTVNTAEDTADLVERG